MRAEERLKIFKELDQPGPLVNGLDSKIDSLVVKLMWGDRREMLKWAIAETEAEVQRDKLRL